MTAGPVRRSPRLPRTLGARRSPVAVRRSPPLAFIALGSNLGDSVMILRQAMAGLQKFSIEPLLKSSLWQTTPVDCPPGSPVFINAVVGLAPAPGETPESLQEKLQALEKEFGRQPKKALNEPRLLDLDLLAFGNEVRATPQLVLPHPRLHRRRFVLAPLNEIAPELLLPGQTRTIRELQAELQSSEVVQLISGGQAFPRAQPLNPEP